MDYSGYIHSIREFLFDGTSARLRDRLVDLIEQNYALGGPKEGFMYGGEFHSTLSHHLRRSFPVKRLIHPSLRDEAKDYMAEKQRIIDDSTRIRHGLASFFCNCADEQDVRNMLPTSVARAVPGLSELNKNGKTDWLFRQHPILKHQHEQIVDLMEYYVALKIL